MSDNMVKYVQSRSNSNEFLKKAIELQTLLENNIKVKIEVVFVAPFDV